MFWRPLILFVKYLIKDISAVGNNSNNNFKTSKYFLGNLIYEGQNRVLKQNDFKWYSPMCTSIIMIIGRREREKEKKNKWKAFNIRLVLKAVTNDSRDDLFCLNGNWFQLLFARFLSELWLFNWIQNYVSLFVLSFCVRFAWHLFLK